MATTTIKIGGMTCGACTSAIESGLDGVAGVKSVSVSLVMERAVVIHDTETISTDKIREIIEDRGFNAEILSTNLSSPRIRRKSAKFADEKQSGTVANTTVAIEGMTCGACTSAIESAFENITGVHDFNISLSLEKALIRHDTAIITKEQIVDMIEDRGFGAEITDSEVFSRNRISASAEKLMTTTTVAIEGMTCGACTSAVEGAFSSVDGVIRFNISLLAERAVITHDATKLTAEAITEAIEDRGFGATIISSEQESTASSLRTSSQFKLYGDFSASSATLLEDNIRTLKGVTSAIVNISTSKITVVHNPLVTGMRALVDMAEKQGFNALVSDSDDNNSQLESLAKTREINEWQRAFKISLSCAVPVFFLNMMLPMMPALDFGKFELIPGLFLGDVICLSLTIPIQFGIGKRFYISAYKGIKHKSPTMDVLVVIGTSCAFFFSLFLMLVAIFCSPHNRPKTIFDTSTMLITFITLGRFLENRAKGQTSQALSQLMSLTPTMATIYIDPIAAEKAAEAWDKEISVSDANPSTAGAADERHIPTELVEVGDVVILHPGDKIPADGILVRGETYVDESMVTGESMPVQKKKGSQLIGGTVNGHSRVDFRVTRAGRDTQLSQIVKLVQDAQTARAPIQRLADFIAGYFVPVILALGLITFFGWMILSHVMRTPPHIFMDKENGGRTLVCLKLCISVIVFACPCALGLATPTAVMVGTGVGAANGILVKGGAALETATRITRVVLDKTGTLTMGKMTVESMGMTSNWNDNGIKSRTWWMIVGLAEMGSEHPVGKAILNAARGKLNIDSESCIDGNIGEFKTIVGQGISATVEPAAFAGRQRYTALIGSAKYLKMNEVDVPEDVANDNELVAETKAKSASAGNTRVFVAIDGQYAGFLSLADTIKEDAYASVAVLHYLGIQTAMVTGDQIHAALAVARAVGISNEDVYAGVTPDQKQEIIRGMQERGERVAMVGDGINDSPALATANIGIAMASGTDVAMETADIVLMRPNDLMSIPAALHLSRTIFNRIKLNLTWACMYNIVGLPFAMGIFLPFGLHLHPMAAGAAMACSSVSVVVSSLLLKFWKRPQYMEDARTVKPGKPISFPGHGLNLNLNLNPVAWVAGLFDMYRSRHERDYMALSNMERD
ncbi:Cu(2+)-transporting P-type ATPase [Ceratocystis pirilliformis]|uniref:Cu(2+)-transporting P-type ATPase n=1 Tax=Ceratocystis pirilliformis TaxID=259994 RepID=A0ABR3YTL5_9PEZI